MKNQGADAAPLALCLFKSGSRASLCDLSILDVSILIESPVRDRGVLDSSHKFRKKTMQKLSVFSMTVFLFLFLAFAAAIADENDNVTPVGPVESHKRPKPDRHHDDETHVPTPAPDPQPEPIPVKPDITPEPDRHFHVHPLPQPDAHHVQPDDGGRPRHPDEGDGRARPVLNWIHNLTGWITPSHYTPSLYDAVLFVGLILVGVVLFKRAA
jgi:hypothetical protein